MKRKDVKRAGTSRKRSGVKRCKRISVGIHFENAARGAASLSS